MDAKELDQARVGACSFMVMTAQGPVSMCQHNPRRDDYILDPIEVMHTDGRVEIFEPLPAQKRIHKTQKYRVEKIDAFEIHV